MNSSRFPKNEYTLELCKYPGIRTTIGESGASGLSQSDCITSRGPATGNKAASFSSTTIGRDGYPDSLAVRTDAAILEIHSDPRSVTGSEPGIGSPIALT